MKKLFEKGYIGKLQLKNRVVMTAMTTGFAGKDVTLMPGKRLVSVEGNTVNLVNTEDNAACSLNADYVLLAMGQKVDTEAMRVFEDSFDRVVILGESKKAPGRIATSLADGYIEALGFNPEA